MKKKLQAIRNNQQLKDKNNIALDRTIMSNHEEQHYCNTLKIEFLMQDVFILGIISEVLEMKLSFSWWLWKA